jgi:hypothetical protein
MSSRLRVFAWIIIGVLAAIWLPAVWFVMVYPQYLSNRLAAFILGAEAVALCLALIVGSLGNSESGKSGMS